MNEWFNSLDIKLQVIFISSLTSIVIFFLGWLFRVIYERTSLNYRLKKEFQFEQKKKLKEEIAKNKTHLLNSIEELNHRLWNFSQHVDKNWHKIEDPQWHENDQYYLKSFIYRYLKFLYWTLKTEKDTISVDTTIADNSDILFLKYVKTFKDIFTDADLLEELNYDRSKNTNHFFKNDLVGYSKYVLNPNGRVLDFDEFQSVINRKHTEFKEVVNYFSNIENNKNDKNDKNLNILRCFHLISIQFLNTFGHDYQKTKISKIYRITDLYRPEIQIKNGLNEFIEKSKLKSEMKQMLSKITVPNNGYHKWRADLKRQYLKLSTNWS
ncbi:hypothetical protein [Salegentibacter flavus]|uniref:Uncharacterized protein n=1 Tax=Salegentibacter flavus TaxID=287099 RepID=A0A1I5CEK1_9FLAO|nr:hypothetical protein [Salegentibacter flavus]SFN85367.1 hypothetical protein SAMN05660413_02815 [Salegentibacter flavus]